MAEISPTTADSPDKTGRPKWLAPAVVILIVVAVVYGGKKKDEISENPLVDFAVLTVGVFAFAAVFRWSAVKLGSPGLASFFGASATTN